MKLLHTHDRTPGCPHTGRGVSRTAVRGIAFEAGRLLMVYSPVNGDYKFPGGGVDAGEPILAALAREIQEECGMRLVEVLGEYGSMVEYDLAEEPDMDYFVMTSHYYRVRVDGTGGAQRLDDYERELGFRPEWVEINAAIANNRAVYAENRPGRPKWIPRDLYVLEHLRDGSGGL